MVILTSGVYQRKLVTGKGRFGSKSEGGTLHGHIVICLRAVIGRDLRWQVHPEYRNSGNLVNQLTLSMYIS